ncbi:MAG: LysE family translocator [Candidatus Daviesbacteria bacterium]|nr:LysE family translocator [Candidatus Daviesbacteria bacterium]
MPDIIPTILLLSLISAATPGPLTTLIIGETLKHGKGAGIKIATAPLFTDLPILLFSIFILSKLAGLNILLGTISLFGACYLAYLAYGSIKTKSIQIETTSGNKSFMKGIVVNFLNPNPYIFYFSILGPLIVKGMKDNFLLGPLSVFIFLGVFVLLNMSVALSVHVAKQFFSSKKYVYVIRILGLILLFFAYTFFRQSLQFFGVFK